MLLGWKMLGILKLLIPVLKSMSPMLRHDIPAPRVQRPAGDPGETGMISLLDLGEGWMTSFADGGRRAFLAPRIPSPAVVMEKGVRREVRNAIPILVFMVKGEEEVSRSGFGVLPDHPVEAGSSSVRVTRCFWRTIVHPLCDIGSCRDIGNNIDPGFSVPTILNGIYCSDFGDKFEELVPIGEGAYAIQFLSLIHI